MDTAVLERINAWIDAHFDELLRELEALVKIPSVARYDDPLTPFGTECFKALLFMRQLSESYGLQSRTVDDRCIEIAEDLSHAGIALWNHLDVVPPGDGWEHTQPFKPVRLGDYLIGRGADDNKGPAIASLFLMRMFKELGIGTRHGLRLCLGTDEEQRMTDVQRYAATQPAARLNIVADCGFPVCYGEKGILSAEVVSRRPLSQISAFRGGAGKNIVPDYAEMVIKGASGAEDLRLTAHGTSAHSAYPDGSVNAIEQLCRGALARGSLDSGDRQIIAFFAELCGDTTGAPLGICFSDEISGKTTCVGSMVTMDEMNRAVLSLNIRYSVTADAEKMLEQMRRACIRHDCDLLHADVNEPNYYPPDAPVVQTLTRVYNEMTGSNAKPYVMGGGTYARKLPNALGFGLGGLPKPKTELFKPGHGAFHQPDEALYIPNLRRAMPILAMAILEADKVL